jgi:thioesterase domain-containing protein
LAKEVLAVRERYPDEPVNVVGHSRGANRAIGLTNELHDLGIRVDTLVTLDPVAFERKRIDPAANADTTWINVFVADDNRVYRNGQGLLNPDRIARAGGIMGFQVDADHNVELLDWDGREFGLTGHMAVVSDRDMIEEIERLLAQ